MDWYIIYIIGIIVLIAGVLIFMKNRKHDKTAVLWLLTAIFITLLIWDIPIEISLDIYSAPEAVFTAVLKSVGALKVDSYSKEQIGTWWVYSLYSASIMFLRILIIPFVFGAVLSYFKTPHKLLSNWLWRKRKTYVFIGLTDKNLNIARSIGEAQTGRLIFILDKSAEDSTLDVLNNLNILAFERSEEYIFSKIIKDKKIYSEKNPVEIFIFKESEEENINELRKLYDVVKEDKNRHLKVYLETEVLSWNNQNNIQTQFGNGDKLIVRFVRSEYTFALNNLFNNSLIDRYISYKGKKIIKVLVIGMDKCSMSMLKCMLWLGQLPGYKLEICTIDSGKYIEEFKYHCPEIQMDIDAQGLASYTLCMHENVEFHSEIFKNIINEYSDFTFAFVNCGNSITNSNLVEDLFTARVRNKKDDNYTIQLKNKERSVFADINSSSWNHVIEVGTLQEVYSYKSITNSEIENAARLVHEERQSHKEENKRVPWKNYCKDEYMRNSVLARALCLRYKLSIIHYYYNSDYSLLETREWMEYEHMRWNVYTWLLGYIRGDRTDKGAGKTHTDLVPFDELSPEIQSQDAIIVNKDIIDTLLF